MQQIIRGMQNDRKRLVCAFDKSTIAKFSSHEIESGRMHVIHRLQIAMASHNPFTDVDGHVP
jgi:hypothetical protein